MNNIFDSPASHIQSGLHMLKGSLEPLESIQYLGQLLILKYISSGKVGSHLKGVVKQEELFTEGIGQVLNGKVKLIQEAELSLPDSITGVDFTKVSNEVILQIVHKLWQIEEGSESEAYSSLIDSYGKGKHFVYTDGQFQAPNHLVNLLIGLSEPSVNLSVCDSTPWVGTVLIKWNKVVGITPVFGNYSYIDNELCKSITKINLFLHGLHTPSDTEVYDRVFGALPLGNINLKKEIDVLLSKLGSEGKAFIIVPPNILTRQKDKAVRERLILSGLVESIIKLPPKLFYELSPSCSVLILSKTNKSSVRFIDGSKESYLNYLTETGVSRILEAYSGKRSELLRREVEIHNVIKNDYRLNIESYVQTPSTQQVNIKDLLTELEDLEGQVVEANTEFYKCIKDLNLEIE